MRPIIYIMMAIAIIAAVSCQSKYTPTKSYTHEITDSKGNKMLLGKCRKESLQQAPFDKWFNKNYSDYRIDSNTCEILKTKLAQYQFSIFMGTWCGDSRREVPRMFKILDYCGVKPSHIKLVMLGSMDSLYKQSPKHEERGQLIHRVPDFIVLKNNVELGRIVEEPSISLEKDLLAIINHENYKPHFEAVRLLDSLLDKNKKIVKEENLLKFAGIIKPICRSSNEINSYGYVKMAAGELDKAEAAFKVNILLFPMDANMYDSMGDYYLKTGQIQLAKMNFEKALQIEPSKEASKKKLAQFTNN